MRRTHRDYPAGPKLEHELMNLRTLCEANGTRVDTEALAGNMLTPCALSLLQLLNPPCFDP